jgi:hypothetical protein
MKGLARQDWPLLPHLRVPLTCPLLSFTKEYDKVVRFHLRFDPGWGARGARDGV